MDWVTKSHMEQAGYRGITSEEARLWETLGPHSLYNLIAGAFNIAFLEYKYLHKPLRGPEFDRTCHKYRGEAVHTMIELVDEMERDHPDKKR